VGLCTTHGGGKSRCFPGWKRRQNHPSARFPDTENFENSLYLAFLGSSATKSSNQFNGLQQIPCSDENREFFDREYSVFVSARILSKFITVKLLQNEIDFKNTIS